MILFYVLYLSFRVYSARALVQHSVVFKALFRSYNHHRVWLGVLGPLVVYWLRISLIKLVSNNIFTQQLTIQGDTRYRCAVRLGYEQFEQCDGGQ